MERIKGRGNELVNFCGINLSDLTPGENWRSDLMRDELVNGGNSRSCSRYQRRHVKWNRFTASWRSSLFSQEPAIGAQRERCSLKAVWTRKLAAVAEFSLGVSTVRSTVSRLGGGDCVTEERWFSFLWRLRVMHAWQVRSGEEKRGKDGCCDDLRTSSWDLLCQQILWHILSCRGNMLPREFWGTQNSRTRISWFELNLRST